MRIAINTRLMLKGRMDGIGWFTSETMARMARMQPHHGFWFLFDRQWDPSFNFPDNVTPVVVPPVTRLPSLLKLWNTVSVPLALRTIQPDLYLSPDGFLPSLISCNSIVAIHDLNFEHFPAFLPVRYRRLYRNSVERAAKQASRIITVSEFSKTDIATTYQIEKEKIDVVYSGLNQFVKPVSQAIIDQAHSRFNINRRYFIVSGSLHPRKNIDRTIRAYTRFRENSDHDIQLVFAGNSKWISSEMRDALAESPFRHDIIFTGRISDTEMNGLLMGAYAMVYVSLFEGFGLPLLEAAAAGIPVVTSNNSSMKEIAGNAALLVNPHETNEIAAGLMQLSSDEPLRARLVAESHKLLTLYTWDRTAELTWKSIAKTLGITPSTCDDTPRPLVL